MDCILKEFFRCDSKRISEQELSALADAVNKLCIAVGDTGKTVEYSETDGDVVAGAIHAVKMIAQKLEKDRLRTVAKQDVLGDMQTELNAARETIATLSAEKTALEDNASAQRESSEKFRRKRLDLAVSLIKFRDQMLYYKSECAQTSDERALKLLDTLYKESGRFMDHNGVEPLDKSGVPFSELYQSVYGVENTDNIDLNDIVADTHRPGYRIEGELYRPQEVVIYVQKQ